MTDFRDAYAAKLRAHLVSALAAAEKSDAPHPIVAKLTHAVEELDARSDVKPAWVALDAYRAWCMERFDPSSGSSSPPTGGGSTPPR